MRPVEVVFRGLPNGPEYKVGPKCCNPDCGKLAEHAHHLWRRTATGGATDWIEVDGRIVGNKVAICWDCHNDLTGPTGGHAAAIRYHHGLFWWAIPCAWEHGKITDYLLTSPIVPQPPTPESLASSRASGSSEESEHACPMCGQVKRRRPSTSAFGRRRKSWTVLVPDDAENGADVLDVLVDDLALVIGVEPNRTGRYYVILPAVYYAHQEKARFVESLSGVGG